MSSLLEALQRAEQRRKNKGRPLAKLRPAAKKGRDVPMPVVIPIVLIVVVSAFKISLARFNAPQQQKKAASSAVQFSSVNAQSKLSSVVKKISGGLKLEGISCDKGDCMAVINGEIVRKEGKVGALVVKDITPRSVELQNPKDSSITTLKVVEGSI